jgi:hypothetical protein
MAESKLFRCQEIVGKMIQRKKHSNSVPLPGFQEGAAYLLIQQLDQDGNPQWLCT